MKIETRGRKHLDITGITFGHLRAVRRVGTSRAKAALWACECSCGLPLMRDAKSLIRLRGGQCLHARAESGRLRLAFVREYQAWISLKNRCNNPRAHRYADYGGRGIRVHQDWLRSFPAFLAAVGPRPTPTHSLDRIGNDRGYEPGNCRWATPKEQANNTRRRRR